ncbi:MAG: GTP cyclohydrolase MptA [Thermoplasmatales archaeon]|nr:GTP cyclohydrolase MptA [Thermoplasmatales archaeon]MCW6170455.1 GTP cyclohydrolase MptA [Thermoplasmatales archaeon]
MIESPDVQATSPYYKISINEAGVSGVKFPIKIERNGHIIDLSATANVFVDLPEGRKGADFSREIESIYSVISSHSLHSIEDVSFKVASLALEKMPYSTVSRVYVSADYFRKGKNDAGMDIFVPYTIFSNAVARSNGVHRLSIGVVVQGMSSCPCAMESTRALMVSDFPELEVALKKIPTVTHNQRNRITLEIETPDGSLPEADDMIKICEDVLGGSLQSLLKRMDEARLVYNSHKKPMFVEDIVREVAAKAAEKFADFPQETMIKVSSESDESIHPHNARAHISLSLREIKEQLDKTKS